MIQKHWGTLVLVSLVVAFLLAPQGIRAQEAGGDNAVDETATQESAGEAENAEGGTTLPRQFRQMVLGMGMDELQQALQNDDLFNFRGERDVSFLPVREESLIETSGSSFIRRAFFQLRDGSLFIMSFTMNPEMIDHHSLFTTLVRRYGQPTYLNPRESVWETEDTRISLERPLSVRYIDRRVFDDIVSESSLMQSSRVQQRQEFLDEF